MLVEELRSMCNQLYNAMPARPSKLALSGSLWIQQGADLLGGADRIALLEAIHDTGSMTQAAKVVGISYKTAWDRVQDMSNTAGHTLVARQTGGAGGGGTSLTPYALELIQAFRHIEQTHERILAQLTKSLARPQEVLKTLSLLGLRTSARNQLVGTVTQVQAGEVDALVSLALPGAPEDDPDILHVSLTMASVKELKIAKGIQAVVLVKAPAVSLLSPKAAVDPTMRNRLRGQVAAFHAGAQQTEVQVRLRGGQTMVSTLAAAQATRLKLVEGAEVVATFHEGAAILGVS
jgi:molybdate transport system regulatory protein